MKPIVRRLRKLEDRFAPQVNEKGQTMVEVILERRRRRAEAAGEPYEDPPLKSLFDAHGRPQTLAEVLRRAGKRARERDLARQHETTDISP